MANLKQDLLNNLGNDKYYTELELARLAQEPNMNYKHKIGEMESLLKKLASIDLATQLVGKYFQDAEPPQANAPEANAPTPEQPKAHPGQTHGE